MFAFYSRMPLLWLALAYACGRLAPVWLLGALLAVLLVGCWLFSAANRAIALRLWCIGCLAGGLGAGTTGLYEQSRPQPLAVPAGRTATVLLQGKLLDDARPTPFGRLATMQASHMVFQGDTSSFSASVMVYFPVGAGTENFLQGQTVACEGRFGSLATIKNEGYRKYLTHQGIVATFRTDSLVANASGNGTGLTTGLLAFRSGLSGYIERAVPDSATSGLIRAFLLGDRSGISPDTKRVFQISGAAHLIAISGQQFSILLYALGLALGLSKWRGAGYKLRLGLVLVFILCFVVIAGGSPSVLRAGLMSSIALLGLFLERRAVALNLLALSFILLSVLRPNLLYDASFQLSHAAVLGILLVQPVLAARLAGRPAWQRYVLEIFCMTLAAQLFTLPLSLFLFGQFPTYGLLANLVLVPLGGLLTLLAFLWLVVSWVPGVGALLLWVVTLLAHVVQGISGWVATLPYAQLTDAYLPAWAAWALGLVLAGGGFWLFLRQAPRQDEPAILA